MDMEEGILARINRACSLSGIETLVPASAIFQKWEIILSRVSVGLLFAGILILKAPFNSR